MRIAGLAPPLGCSSGPGYLGQPLSEKQFGALAVGQQVAVERNQSCDQPLEPPAPPAAQLVAEVGSVAEKHPPGLPFAFDEALDVVAPAHPRGKLGELGGAALERQQQPYRAQRKLA